MSTVLEQIQANLQALGFSNTSGAAVYNKIAQGIAIPIDTTLTEISNSEQRILDMITKQRYGKQGYYVDNALAFQYGDNLVIDPTTFEYVYAEFDPAKKIITQAAFEEISSLLFLKVATTNALSGDLEPLSIPQKAAFDAYFVNFEIPGLPVSKMSAAPNVLNFNGNVKFYPTYDLPTLKDNIETALRNFRRSFKFNGEFFTGDLQDYLKQNVAGVRDVYLYNTTIDGNPFGGYQPLSAGYFNYTPTILTNLVYAPV